MIICPAAALLSHHNDTRRNRSSSTCIPDFKNTIEYRYGIGKTLQDVIQSLHDSYMIDSKALNSKQ